MKFVLLKYKDILGCRVGDLSTLHSGLPLCLGSATKSMWNLVVERVETKLSTWKINYLSIEGRVTLIKSVMSNLPVYYFSLFKCPTLIIKRIERLLREFL